MPQCEVLRSKWPDFGHLVHMASHIDVQVGAYGEAVDANQRAIVADRVFLDLRGAGNFYFG